jgi:hypothetical protein
VDEWMSGGLEDWRTGGLEYWSTGVLEYWLQSCMPDLTVIYIKYIKNVTFQYIDVTYIHTINQYRCEYFF